MSFPDLRSFIRYLERTNDLVRVKAQVDPNQEITIIQHRVIEQNGPALLFENVKGSSFPILSNMFGTKERTDLVFGGSPQALGERIFTLSKNMMPPSFSALLKSRKDITALSRARMKKVKTGPVLDRIHSPCDLNRLPVLTCWPEDGGPFFTLPLVHTKDPENNAGNLGIYRMQRFDARSTGMHWQIEKGGGFHFHKAVQMKRSLPVSVFLGGPPALTISGVAPLPEGIDERLLCAYMIQQPLEVIFRPETGHLVPARAEFVLEGTVTAGDEQWEGPFGDHFGHYSNAADYPVFRVDRVLARKDAIYPATVVGKPVQEDFHMGAALQEMTLPLLRMIRPAVTDIWAYPETGFHALAVMSVNERYPKEALKHTLGMLGEGQVSLTKVMITVGSSVNVKDFDAVSRAVWRYLDPDEGIHLLSPTAQDTLDFTGPAMNTGSRLILMATESHRGPLRKEIPPVVYDAEGLPPDVVAVTCLGPSFLIAKVKETCTDTQPIRNALKNHPVAGQYLFHVLVSEDIPMADPAMILWGWFTRFDPLADLYPAEKKVVGNRLLFKFPIAIDARWKKGYPRPVAFDPDIEKKVENRWHDFGIGF